MYSICNDSLKAQFGWFLWAELDMSLFHTWNLIKSIICVHAILLQLKVKSRVCFFFFSCFTYDLIKSLASKSDFIFTIRCLLIPAIFWNAPSFMEFFKMCILKSWVFEELLCLSDKLRGYILQQFAQRTVLFLFSAELNLNSVEVSS